MVENTCKLKWRFFHLLTLFFSLSLFLAYWMDDDVKKVGLESKLKECSLSGITSLLCLMFHHLI